MKPPPSPTSSLRVKRESTAFSSVSNSSRSRASISGFLPSFPTRDRVPFTLGLDSTSPRLPDVSGRSDLANHIIAEQLKKLLDTDEHPAPPNSSPSNEIKSDLTASTLPHVASSSISSRLLSEAFRREYSETANDERKRAYSTMYTEQEEDRVSRFSRAPSFAPSTASQSERGGGRKKFRAESQPALALILPGLGEGKQRNVNGKSLYGGQDVGVGVIGSQAFLDSMAGGDGNEAMNQECDIPMPAAGCDWMVRQIDGEEEGMKFMVGPHVVSLEEGLPPLAAEHPVRVWNSVLHSLPQNLLPTVQWKYERVPVDEEEDSEPMHICQLTLSLSPDHPAIATHPSFPQLPTNRHTAEYVTVAAAIGGSRAWTGEAKATKTDATNSALVKSITSGAFEWLHNSSLNESVLSINARPPSRSPHDESQEASPEPIQPTSSASDGTIAEAPEQSWEVVPFVNREALQHIPKPIDEFVAIPASETPSKAQPLDDASPVQQTIQRLFAKLPAGSKAKFAMSVEWDGNTRSFVEKLHLGTKSHQQSFLVDYRSNDLGFGSAVITVASEQGLDAFLKVIEDLQSISGGAAAGGGCGSGAAVIDVPVMELGDGADVLVDWVEQLKAFCRSNNLRFPTYTQQVERLAVGDGVKFRATMKLEEENFCASSAYNTILQARQEMARWVFCEHFGQHAAALEQYVPDAGWKGRGGRGGNKRGRNKW